METIIGISAAVPVATALVMILKFAYPTAPSKFIAAGAFIAGQLGASLIAMAGEGLSPNQKVIATVVISGIMATVTAMGLRAGESRADAGRIGPEVQAARIEAAQQGAIQESRELNREMKAEASEDN